MRPKLARHLRHLLKHATRATHASTPPTLARYPLKHATHAIHAGTPPRLACHPHHSPQYATHASTKPKPPKIARYPQKRTTHATHANMNSTPFLKLIFSYAHILSVFGKFYRRIFRMLLSCHNLCQRLLVLVLGYLMK